MSIDMNNQIILSDKELLYISSLLGIANIWGVDDPFLEMSETSIQLEIIRIQRVLSQKGYGSLDESGVFNIEENVLDTLRLSSHYTNILIFSSDEMEDSKEGLRFFINNQQAIRFFNRESTSILSAISMDEMANELSQYFSCVEERYELDSLTARSSKLKRLGRLSRNRFIQELRENGCNDSFSIALADGLQGQSSFRVLLCYARNSHGDPFPVDKLITIHFPGGDLMAISNLTQESDTISFSWLSSERIGNEIKRILSKVE